ncbi:MAG TPA: ATP-binding protein [Thermoanaerobaculia bacterium]|nr:ATP-binding protein [Thermoanaerobaculia bacterium]
MPLLAAALSGERRLGMAESESATAARSAVRAEVATIALDQVRGELQRALGRLQEMDRRKDEFLALLAHELRNPLAPILTSLELLRIGAPDKAARAREVIERNARHLARLIDDLLDVARIARGRIVLRRERVELSDLVASGVEIATPLITSHGHRLAVSLPDEEVWLEADPLRIAQVLSNLLNNAAKFTDPGGRIGLKASREGDAAVIEVWDTGIGIAPQLLSRIFDLFAQEQSSLERSQGGLGVGLSLARRLVEMHGGVLTVSSGGPGQGSEFRVTLPVLTAAEASTVYSVPPAHDEDPAPAEPRGRRVLVVDDSPDTVAGLADLLREWGHSVETAGDGLSAVEAASTFRPDVVLLDIGLPGMDGFEVARRLRADSSLSAALLIAVTGYGQEADRTRALEAGFDHHMLKPIDFARLETLLASSRSAEKIG